jgi:hypothetical protein
MTRLTRAKDVSLKSTAILGIFLMVVIVLRVAWGFINNTLFVQPAKLRASLPTVKYGPIPTPILPISTVSTASTTLQLDLVDGQFPQASAAANIYRVAKPSLTLSAQDRARSRANQLGFAAVSPTQPTPTIFAWDSGGKHLQVDLGLQTFSYMTDASKITFTNRDTFTPSSPVNSMAGAYLKDLVRYDDLQFSAPQIQFVAPSGNSYLPQPEDATALTNYVRATVLRTPIDNTPILSTSGEYGPISLIMIPGIKPDPQSYAYNSNTPSQNEVIWLTSTYLPIDLTTSSTYPIISASTAYTQLQSNFKNYLVSVEPATSTTVPTNLLNARILFAKLVYLEPDPLNTQYVQPAWMFKGRGQTDAGDARWLAYVPAIDATKTSALVSQHGQ